MSTYVIPSIRPTSACCRPSAGCSGCGGSSGSSASSASACSLLYTLISIAIPILIQRAIDNAIVPHTQDRSRSGRISRPSAGSPLLRFVINFNRRYATARIGIRIEARMRELLYQAYLRYPRAFYDRHATGQVLSRATNDLYPIRYFIGWGLVQGIAERDDDRRRRDRPRARRPTTDALRGRFAAADRVRRQPLRTSRLTDLAPGAGAEGRRDGSRGRGRRRNRDGAGLRPRERRARALRRAGPRASAPPRSTRPASRRRTYRASTTCRPSRSPQSSSSAAARSSTAQHHHRPVRPLRDAPPPARLAARGASGGSSTWRSGRSPRPAAASAGSTASSRCPSRLAPRICRDQPLGLRFEQRELRLRRRGGRAARSRLRRRAGRDRGRLRIDGRRQDVAAEPSPALLRPDRRERARRRRRHARPADRRAAC